MIFFAMTIPLKYLFSVVFKYIYFKYCFAVKIHAELGNLKSSLVPPNSELVRLDSSKTAVCHMLSRHQRTGDNFSVLWDGHNV